MSPSTAATLARLIYAGAAHIAESGNAAGAAADLADVQGEMFRELEGDTAKAFEDAVWKCAGSDQ